jgi:DinB family protein
MAVVRGWDRWDYPIWDVRIGEWTVAQVLQHLIAVEWHVVNARLDSLETEVEPHWAWSEPGPADGIGDGSIAAAAVVFAASREATVDRLRTMPLEAWRRTGVHATYGRLDVARLLEVMLEHDEAHLSELERLV